MTAALCASCGDPGPFPKKGTLTRKVCVRCFNQQRRARYAGLKSPKSAPKAPSMRKRAPRGDRYVVTYAQNATPVHQPFLKALLQYCKRNGAELIVIPGRYKNPTSRWSRLAALHDVWDDALAPFLFNGREALSKDITVYGDVSIQPTADRPLTGFEAFTGTSSAIFGHPKLQLATVATAGAYPRILVTTGAVTLPNYIPSKAGKKAHFHHIYGATVVERGALPRQINAVADGSFIELDTYYSADGWCKAPRALALICGDIHEEHSDEEVLAATFDGKDSIVGVLRPEKIVYHDLCDFDRRNHHTIDNFCDRYERAMISEKESVSDECVRACRFIDERTPKDAEPIVVASNHDEAFDRWLAEANPKKDLPNALFFHEMSALKIRRFHETGRWVPALELLYEQVGAGRAHFLRRDEAYSIGGILVSAHGDEGPDGARGSIGGFAKMGAKSIIGHGHSPGIIDGCTRVGVTGSLRQGYNNPVLSSWLNTHGAIYANRKRGLLHVRNRAWRG